MRSKEQALVGLVALVLGASVTACDPGSSDEPLADEVAVVTTPSSSGPDGVQNGSAVGERITAPPEAAGPTAPGETPTDTADPTKGAGVCAGCSAWSTPSPTGYLSSVTNEVSGLAASQVHPGILYTHNDSGDGPRFFAMNEQAAITAEVKVQGAAAWDWEEIAVGPCPSGSCVYVADVGDGGLVRDHYTIYRMAEPQTLPTDGSAVTVTPEAFHFVYPDEGGRHNAEAILVHPKTGRLFVIIKMGRRPTIYEMAQPLVPGATQTLVMLGVLPLPLEDSIVTGASFHPCGERMLVRTTAGLYELSAPGKSPEELFTTTPVQVPVAVEPQGEAVTYSPDGRRYFTASETGSDPAALSVSTCAGAGS